MAAGRGGQEGSVLFNLGQAVQTDRADGALRIPGVGGELRWRLCEVDNILVDVLSGPVPDSEIDGTLNRTMVGTQSSLDSPESYWSLRSDR